MSVKKLDRNRYFALVYGDEAENPKRPRKFMQDGMFFDGSGVAIDASSTPPPAPIPVEEPVVVVEQVVDNSAILAQLNGMTVNVLRKLAQSVFETTDAELPVLNGPGVKARMVKYIADNTE